MHYHLVELGREPATLGRALLPPVAKEVARHDLHGIGAVLARVRDERHVVLGAAAAPVARRGDDAPRMREAARHGFTLALEAAQRVRRDDAVQRAHALAHVVVERALDQLPHINDHNNTHIATRPERQPMGARVQPPAESLDDETNRARKHVVRP